MRDQKYTGIPYRFHGRDRGGCDCAGIVMLWLREEMGLEISAPGQYAGEDFSQALAKMVGRHGSRRGEVVFFREEATGKIRHAAVHLGNQRYLHSTIGGSRIDNGLELLRRAGYTPVKTLGPEDVPALAAALNQPALADPVTAVMLIVSIALSVASAFLTPRPKIGQYRDQTGRYGFDQLYTQQNPTIPMPDILGAMCVAGNSPYQTLIDKTQPVTDPTSQKSNKVVVLASGPIDDVTFNGAVIKVNGTAYNATYWHTSGMALNPTQDKANAMDGTIGSDANRPSLTTYTGAHAISVPVDIRASYDRNFPVYGFAGAGYLVFRLIDSTKFSQFNVTVTIKGRACRKFDTSGFVLGTVSGESLAGADGSKVRFKLANFDVKQVTSVTVGGTAYTQISGSNQSGDVFAVNLTKGYIEFLTAPGAGATILASYTYYTREWSQNPAMHLVYLLTEKLRGKGLDETRIDWARAVELRDYCDEVVPWQTSSGLVMGPRYQTNYSIDAAKTIQEHLRAILDGCYAFLFVSNGRVVMKARRDEASVFSFDSTNILVTRSGDERASTFSAELADRSGRANRLRLYYHSAETQNAETDVSRDDVVDQDQRAPRLGNDGVVEETLHIASVDSQGQAERLAETMLRENIGSQWLVEFKTTIKGLAIEPGDVIDVTHDLMPSWDKKLFRVEEVTLDAQDYLTLQCSEYVAGAYI